MCSLEMTDSPYCMDWNYNGSLIGTITKDKVLSVGDPRAGDSKVQSVQAHEGGKCQRLNWVGNSANIVTVGYSYDNNREWAYWDSRRLSQPIVEEVLDNNKNIFFTHYDDASKILFIVNRGSSFINMFHLDQESTSLPQLASCDKHNDGKDAQSVHFMPKRYVDCSKNEIVRALKLSGKTAQYISFKVPRRDNNFAEELFPPYPEGRPSMSAVEWKRG